MSRPLTDRQAEILAFINTFRRAEQCNPTMAEIARHFNFMSANSAQEHCAALRKKGVIRKRDERQHSRGYIVTWPHSGEMA